MDLTQLDTEGLPLHMMRSMPHTIKVVVEQRLTDVHDHSHLVNDGHEYGYEYSKMRGRELIPMGKFEYTEQLERDGKPLTKSDRLPSWRAGEKDGWL